MFAILAVVAFAVALVLDLAHVSVGFPFVTAGLLLLALHLALGTPVPWGRRQ